MQFNRHPNLEGKHALLSASSWRWINDNEESLIKRLCSQYSQMMGTILHEIACKHIRYRVKLNKYDKKNIALELLANGIPNIVISNVDFDSVFDNMMAYVNDGVGFKMEPEVVLCYSNNFFGTVDTIKFSETEKFLRIHDYKSGATPAHMEQLMIYAALFCLEYRIKPTSFESELRLYQNNEIIFHNPTSEEIMSIMDGIVEKDKFINKIKED